MDMKRFFLYVSMIAALALAGCGGGGNGVDPAPPPPPPPMTCPGDPDCPPPPPTTKGAFPGTAMEAAMAIVAPNKDGDPADLRTRRPTGIALTQTTTNSIQVTVTSPATATPDILGMDDMDIEDADEFQPKTDAAPLSITDWDPMVMERTVDDVTDTVTLYLDKAAPKDVQYLTYFADDNAYMAANPDTRPEIVQGVTDITDADTSAADKRYDTGDGVLNLGTAVGDDYKLFYADAFKLGPSTTRTYAGEDDAQTPDMKENEFAGTFAGVEGTYICGAGTGNMCSATTNAKGNLMTLTDNWTFRPTAAGARGRVQDVDIDTDYLKFGYWVQATKKSDGTTSYGVSTFASGSMAYGANAVAERVAALQGSATYAGPATGLFVRKTGPVDAALPTSAGQFTADVGLTARFGGTGVAIADQYSVSGTVDNFQGDGVDPNWEVDLSRARFATPTEGVGTADAAITAYDTHVNSFDGSTTGKGVWMGSFFGPSTGTNDPATPANEMQTPIRPASLVNSMPISTTGM